MYAWKDMFPLRRQFQCTALNCKSNTSKTQWAQHLQNKRPRLSSPEPRHTETLSRRYMHLPSFVNRQGVDPSDLGPVLPHEQVLDRFETHTKHCSACSKAFKGSKSRRTSQHAKKRFHTCKILWQYAVRVNLR